MIPVPMNAQVWLAAGVDPETYHEARNAAPGWDVRHLEQEWRKWCAAEEIEPKKPDRHFVKFCQSWFEKRGRP